MGQQRTTAAPRGCQQLTKHIFNGSAHEFSFTQFGSSVHRLPLHLQVFSFSERMENDTYDYYQDNGTVYDYVPYSQRIATYLVPIIFSLIFVVGTLGNGTLVLVLLRHRNLRSIPNTYIFSLALGDLLVILTSVPFTSTIYTVESWPFGETICKISEWTKEVSIGVSVFTLTGLSAERYCAIVNPLRRRVMFSAISEKTFTLLATGFIWIISIIFATPAALFSWVPVIVLDEYTNHSIEVCSPFPPQYGERYVHGLILFRFLIYYATPLCVIAWFYIMMAKHLETSANNMPGEGQGQIPQMKARKKIAKMVLAFVALFAICFGPQHAFNIWFFFNPNSKKEYNNYWHVFRIVSFCLAFINSCINPIAFYFISATFRKYFNRYLFACCMDPTIIDASPAANYDRSTTHTTVVPHFSSRRHASQFEGSNKTDHIMLDNT